MRRIVIYLIVVASTCAGIVIIVAVLLPVAADTIWFELLKTLLQIGVVSAAAAALSIVTYEYQRRAQKIEKEMDQQRVHDESRRAWLQSVLTQAGGLYTDIKRARRLLRSRAVSTDTRGMQVVELAPYDDQLAAINDAQLEFETLADEMRSMQSTYGTVSQALASHFDNIEDSLNLLVAEYEESRSKFAGDPRTLKLDDLDRLKRFIVHTRAPRQESEDEPQLLFPPVHWAFSQVQQRIWRELSDSEQRPAGRRRPDSKGSLIAKIARSCRPG